MRNLSNRPGKTRRRRYVHEGDRDGHARPDPLDIFRFHSKACFQTALGDELQEGVSCGSNDPILHGNAAHQTFHIGAYLPRAINTALFHALKIQLGLLKSLSSLQQLIIGGELQVESVLHVPEGLLCGFIGILSLT